MEKSEIRKDYFLNRYVIIAPKRAKRPHKVLKKAEDQLSSCFFCPDSLHDETILQEIKGKDGNWDILVTQNKFPALTTENPRAFGSQEIIIESPTHGQEIHEMSLEHIIKLIDVYIDRYNANEAIEGVKYTIVFKNEGGKAGASVSHSHSQVIALPLLPPAVEEESLAFSRYRLEKESCPYCDIIAKEEGKPRVIWEDENIFVLAPFASQSPYGAWFIPKRHFKKMSEINEGEKKSLAKSLKVILGKLDEIDVAYNFFFHNAVSGTDDYHMHLELSPRPNVWAGLELGTGVIINPIPPEYAAKFYRGEVALELTEDKKHIKIH